MIKNYFKVAIRHLLKNKGYSFINIFGLATGFACSLLIFLFVKDEKSYDRFHKDAGNVYRIVRDFVNDDGTKLPDATTPPAMAPALQRDIPEVANITRIYPNWGANFLVSHGDKKIIEEKIYRVDSSFFDVFTFPFLRGNTKNALKDLNSIVLTESAAKRYFGNDDPTGKDLQLDFLGNYTVTGVLKDIPSNSHFHFDFLISIRKFGDIDAIWGWYNYYTYVKLKSNTNITAFTKKVQDIYKRSNNDGTYNFYLQPLNDIHLASNLRSELESNSDKLYVYIFSIIAIFILFIAGVNYVNLSTAKAAVRAKEVGVRKVSGAFRTSLIGQFIIESVITCFVAAAFAIAIAQLLLPVVNTLTHKSLSVIGNPFTLIYMVIAALFLGMIAGFFPSFYLSSFNPVIVLKGLKLNEKRAMGFRKWLVIIQFTISITLLIGALIISQQMHFIQSAKLGLDKDQVLIVRDAGYMSKSNQNAFQNSLLQLSGVKNVATSDGIVGGQNWTNMIRWKGAQTSQLVNFLSVGNKYLDALNIEFSEGRNFSEKFPGDTINNGIPNGSLDQNIGSIIINETAVKDLGIPSPVVGKQVFWKSIADTMYYLTIVGVVKDFHFTSFRNQIKPFAFIRSNTRTANFTIKLSTDNMKASLSQLETIWKKFLPARPFEFDFLDETYANLYQSEARFQKVFTSLVILGIVIASLGLFGLSTFVAQQRVKEIGIRKVLGASVSSVIALLSKDFLKLVFVALILAIPISWYFTNKWLQDFAYRINVEWWMFTVAGLAAIFIAVITVSFQAVKASIANPVESLRAE